jgi:hypothetical protein
MVWCVLACELGGVGGCATYPLQPYVVPVSRATFARRFPDTPGLASRQVGIILYGVRPTFPPFDLTPPRAYGSMPP